MGRQVRYIRHSPPMEDFFEKEVVRLSKRVTAMNDFLNKLKDDPKGNIHIRLAISDFLRKLK